MTASDRCDRTGLPPALLHKRLDQLIAAYVDNRLELLARQKEYNSVVSVVSFLNDPNPKYHADAVYFINLRSSVWTMLDQVRDDVIAELRPPPTFDELVAMLPNDIKNI